MGPDPLKGGLAQPTLREAILIVRKEGLMSEDISAAFPFESKFLDGVKQRYGLQAVAA